MNKMKITKRQLRRIIKEEKRKLNTEALEYAAGDLEMAVKEVMSILQTMRDPVDRNAEIYMIIDELEDLANRG
jgi:hypothetical protein